MTEMEVRGRLEAEGFHIVSTQQREEEERPIRVFQYNVRDCRGRNARRHTGGAHRTGGEAVLREAGYTVVKIAPAIKTWIATDDGDAYRGYVALDPPLPPSQKQQIARLTRANRLLCAALGCLCVVTYVLMFLLLHRR